MSWHFCQSYSEDYKAKDKTPNSKYLGNKAAEIPQWWVFRNRTLRVVLFESVRHSDPEQIDQHSVN